MNTGERIKARRIELGMSQSELAEKMGYTNRTTISHIESGKIELTQSRMNQFANVLGISHAYLLGLVSEETSAANDRMAQIILKMRKDPEFFEAVSTMAELSASDLHTIKGLLSALGRK